MLRDFETTFDPAQYASLGMVEPADERIKGMRGRFDDFLSEAHSLAVELDVRASLGALLLHRHWDCPKDALMVETLYSKEGSKALVTEAWRMTDLPAQSLPSRYRVGSTGELVPLEYSTDEWVALTHRQADVPKSFGISFRRLLESYDLEDMIGLVLLARNGITMSSTEQRCIEENFDGKSVITFQKVDSESEAKLITTAWPIGKAVNLSCNINCVMECTIYLNCRGYCKGYCQTYCVHGGVSCRHHRYGHDHFHRQDPRHVPTGHDRIHY